MCFYFSVLAFAPGLFDEFSANWRAGPSLYTRQRCDYSCDGCFLLLPSLRTETKDTLAIQMKLSEIIWRALERGQQPAGLSASRNEGRIAIKDSTGAMRPWLHASFLTMTPSSTRSNHFAQEFANPVYRKGEKREH